MSVSPVQHPKEQLFIESIVLVANLRYLNSREPIIPILLLDSNKDNMLNHSVGLENSQIIFKVLPQWDPCWFYPAQVTKAS